jgi:L-ribulokinase
VRADVYVPDAGAARRYDALYAEYQLLHDYFGRGANDVMHRLRAISAGARSAEARSGSAEPQQAVGR